MDLLPSAGRAGGGGPDAHPVRDQLGRAELVLAGVALSGRPGFWDARGARVTAVLPDGRAAYDGRATAEENFSERTGLAVPSRGAELFTAQGDAPVADVRYLDVIPLDDGAYRLYYEAPLADGSHELRTAVVPPGS